MTVMFTMLFSRPKAAAGNERASDPAAEASWWRRHRHLLGGLAFGYVASLVLLWTAGLGSEWISATTAYFVAANLVVLWWYADTTRLLLESTRKQVAVSQAQYVHALRISRIGHKPFVVVERIQREDGYFHYYVRNIGPGLAVNVWFIREAADGSYIRQSLGALGPNGSRVLFGAFEGDLCNRDGVFPFALLAEGLLSRTAQWTATVNVRERTRGGEMLSQPLPLRQTRVARNIEKLLADEWPAIREQLRNSTAGL